MKKQEVHIGDGFGRLTVIALAGSDRRGNQLVRVRCSCSSATEKTVRLANLTFKPYKDGKGRLRKPLKSCGCASREAYRHYLEKRARGLGKRCLRAIWKEHQKGATFQQLGATFRIPAGVASAACRIYHETNPKPIRGAIPRGSKAYHDWVDQELGDLPY